METDDRVADEEEPRSGLPLQVEGAEPEPGDQVRGDAGGVRRGDLGKARTDAELEPRQIGAATGMASVAQQMSVGLGVATGAMVLEISELIGARAHPEAVDFAWAFAVVGLVSVGSSLMMLRLPATAGDEISGRAVPAAQPSPATGP